MGLYFSNGSIYTRVYIFSFAQLIWPSQIFVMHMMICMRCMHQSDMYVLVVGVNEAKKHKRLFSMHAAQEQFRRKKKTPEYVFSATNKWWAFGNDPGAITRRRDAKSWQYAKFREPSSSLAHCDESHTVDKDHFNVLYINIFCTLIISMHSVCKNVYS